MASDLLKDQPAPNLTSPRHGANGGVSSVFLPAFHRAQASVSNCLLLEKGSKGLAWPMGRNSCGDSDICLLRPPPMPLHLGVWGARIVSNQVLCMNLDNAGFIEKSELQFLMLYLLLKSPQKSSLIQRAIINPASECL